MAGLGCSDGEEAEGVGVEAVELVVMAEALDDGLGSREALGGVLVRELGDKAAETGGGREVGTLGVENPSLVCFSLAEEGEESLVLGIGRCGGGSGGGGEGEVVGIGGVVGGGG